MAMIVDEAAPQDAWRGWFAPLGLICALAITAVAGIIVAVVAAIAGASLTHPPPVVSLVSTMFQDGAFVIGAVFVASRAARPRPAQFGLRPAPLLRSAVVFLVGYGAFIVFSGLWVAALKIHDKEKLIDQLGANRNAAALIAVILLTCVIAPICEEFFFRGFCFTALRNWCGRWWAAVITGVVFGAIHAGSAPLGYLVPLAFLGFLLCIVYWETGSLYPCIAIHAVNNCVALGLTEHWSWQIPLLLVGSVTTIVLTLSGVTRLRVAL